MSKARLSYHLEGGTAHPMQYIDVASGTVYLGGYCFTKLKQNGMNLADGHQIDRPYM